MDPLKIAVMFYGAAYLPRLRQLTPMQLKKVTDEASALSLQIPLHLRRDSTLQVPAWREETMTGGEVIALMVFALWVQLGESEDRASHLLEAWPIKEAVLLAQQESVS